MKVFFYTDSLGTRYYAVFINGERVTPFFDSPTLAWCQFFVDYAF